MGTAAVLVLDTNWDNTMPQLVKNTHGGQCRGDVPQRILGDPYWGLAGSPCSVVLWVVAEAMGL